MSKWTALYGLSTVWSVSGQNKLKARRFNLPSIDSEEVPPIAAGVCEEGAPPILLDQEPKGRSEAGPGYKPQVPPQLA